MGVNSITAAQMELNNNRIKHEVTLTTARDQGEQ